MSCLMIGAIMHFSRKATSFSGRGSHGGQSWSTRGEIQPSSRKVTALGKAQTEWAPLGAGGEARMSHHQLQRVHLYPNSIPSMFCEHLLSA